MDYNLLNKQSYYFGNPLLEIYSEKNGYIKKKKPLGFMYKLGFNESSKLKYFRFYQKGRFFSKSVQPPKDLSNIERLLYTKDIIEIEDNYSKKNNHILINFGNYSIHLKFKNMKEKDEWIKILNFFKDFYQQEEGIEKNQKDLENPKMEIVTHSEYLKVAMELEIKDDSYPQTVSYIHKFISDKDLSIIFEKNTIESLRNRLLISTIRMEQKKRDNIPEPKTPATPLPLKSPLTSGSLIVDRFSLSNLSLYYHFYNIVLISQLPNHLKDEDYNLTDKDYIKKDTLPKWMEFNKIYFFDYQEQGDISNYKMSVNLNEVESCFSEKDYNVLKIQMPDQNLNVFFKTCFENFFWMEAIHKSRGFSIDLDRSRFGFIKYDVDSIIYNWKIENYDFINKTIDKISDFFKYDNDFGKFIIDFENGIKEWNFFCDAFYSRRPFLGVLFKYCNIYFYEKIRKFIFKFWEKSYEKRTHSEVFTFLEIYCKLTKKLNFWGIYTKKFYDFLPCIIKYYVFKFFDNSKKILVNILNDLKINTYEEKNKIMTKSSENLETHLDFILNKYDKIKNIEIAKILADYCGIIFMMFLINIKKILEKENLNKNVYYALLNNKYFKVLKNFMKNIFRKTEKQISLKDCKDILKEEYILKLILDVKKKCYEKITFYSKNIVKNYLKKEDDFLKIDFTNKVNNILNDFQKELKKIQDIEYLEDLYNKLFLMIIKKYYRMFYNFCGKNNSKNSDKIEKKIFRDKIFLKNHFKNFCGKNYHLLIFYMEQLYRFKKTEDVDEIIIYLVNIIEFYEKLKVKKNLLFFLGSKTFFPKASKNLIMEYFDNILNEKENLNSSERKKSKKDDKITEFFKKNQNIFVFSNKISNIKRKINF